MCTLIIVTIRETFRHDKNNIFGTHFKLIQSHVFPACTQFLTEVHILSDVTISLYCKITLEDSRGILKDSSLAGIYKAVPNFLILL